MLAGQPSNVDTVFIDGVPRKRDGRLLDVDPGELIRDVEEAMAALPAAQRRDRHPRAAPGSPRP